MADCHRPSRWYWGSDENDRTLDQAQAPYECTTKLGHTYLQSDCRPRMCADALVYHKSGGDYNIQLQYWFETLRRCYARYTLHFRWLSLASPTVLKAVTKLLRHVSSIRFSIDDRNSSLEQNPGLYWLDNTLLHLSTQLSCSTTEPDSVFDSCRQNHMWTCSFKCKTSGGILPVKWDASPWSNDAPVIVSAF